MFEDEEFDLDFSEKFVKSKVAEKEKVDERRAQETNQVSKNTKQSLNGLQKENVLNTQKYMFSMDDTSDSEPNCHDSARDSRLRAGPSTDQQSKSYNSSRDSHFRAGPSREQKSKSHDSTRDSHLRAGPSREQQSKSYDLNGGSHPRAGSKRRFPGPAGLLPILKLGNLAMVVDEDEADENTEQAVPDLQCSQKNADENTVWIKALDDLGMKWGDPDSLVSKYNVGHIKQNAKPGSSIRMTILLARIKNLDTTCLDPICLLRDPHGEVEGSIHRDVIEQFEEEIQVGSILVLRNVIVLMTTKTQYVNITTNNIVSIYSPTNATHIRSVNWKDMEVTAEQVERVRKQQIRDIQCI